MTVFHLFHFVLIPYRKRSGFPAPFSLCQMEPASLGFHLKYSRFIAASEEARCTPFPSSMTKTAFRSLLLPYQMQSICFAFERKTEGTYMELSLSAEAEWSEFRLTTARGRRTAAASWCFCCGKATAKTTTILWLQSEGSQFPGSLQGVDKMSTP